MVNVNFLDKKSNKIIIIFFILLIILGIFYFFQNIKNDFELMKEEDLGKMISIINAYSAYRLDNNGKDFISKEIVIPEIFVCGEWSECKVDYGLNNLNGRSYVLRYEQIRFCTNGKIEEIQRRKCSYKQEILITKVGNDLKFADKNDKSIADLEIVEEIVDGVSVKKLNLDIFI